MNRKYYAVILTTEKSPKFFHTRQEAVEYANAYHDRTGEVAEIEERIARNGKGIPKCHK